jgi:hypothetical protein
MPDALPTLPSAPLGELAGELPDDPLGAPPQLPSIGKREPLRFPFGGRSGGRGGRRGGGTRPPLASVEQLTRAAAARRPQGAAATAPQRGRPARVAVPTAPIIIQTPAPQAAPQPAPPAPRPTAAQRRAAARQAAAPLRAYVGIGQQTPQDAQAAAAQRGRIRRGLLLRQRRPGQPAQPQAPAQPAPAQPTNDPAVQAIRARRAAQYAQMRGVLDALRNPPAQPPSGDAEGGTQP